MQVMSGPDYIKSGWMYLKKTKRSVLSSAWQRLYWRLDRKSKCLLGFADIDARQWDKRVFLTLRNPVMTAAAADVDSTSTAQANAKTTFRLGKFPESTKDKKKRLQDFMIDSHGTLYRLRTDSLQQRDSWYETIHRLHAQWESEGKNGHAAKQQRRRAAKSQPQSVLVRRSSFASNASRGSASGRSVAFADGVSCRHDDVDDDDATKLSAATLATLQNANALDAGRVGDSRSVSPLDALNAAAAAIDQVHSAQQSRARGPVRAKSQPQSQKQTHFRHDSTITDADANADAATATLPTMLQLRIACRELKLPADHRSGSDYNSSVSRQTGDFAPPRDRTDVLDPVVYVLPRDSKTSMLTLDSSGSSTSSIADQLSLSQQQHILGHTEVVRSSNNPHFARSIVVETTGPAVAAYVTFAVYDAQSDATLPPLYLASCTISTAEIWKRSCVLPPTASGKPAAVALPLYNRHHQESGRLLIGVTAVSTFNTGDHAALQATVTRAHTHAFHTARLSLNVIKLPTVAFGSDVALHTFARVAHRHPITRKWQYGVAVNDDDDDDDNNHKNDATSSLFSSLEAWQTCTEIVRNTNAPTYLRALRVTAPSCRAAAAELCEYQHDDNAGVDDSADVATDADYDLRIEIYDAGVAGGDATACMSTVVARAKLLATVRTNLYEIATIQSYPLRLVDSVHGERCAVDAMLIVKNLGHTPSSYLQELARHKQRQCSPTIASAASAVTTPNAPSSSSSTTMKPSSTDAAVFKTLDAVATAATEGQQTITETALSVSCAHLPRKDVWTPVNPIVRLYRLDPVTAEYVFVEQSEQQKHECDPNFARQLIVPTPTPLTDTQEIKVVVFDTDMTTYTARTQSSWNTVPLSLSAANTLLSHPNDRVVGTASITLGELRATSSSNVSASANSHKSQTFVLPLTLFVDGHSDDNDLYAAPRTLADVNDTLNGTPAPSVLMRIEAQRMVSRDTVKQRAAAAHKFQQQLKQQEEINVASIEAASADMTTRRAPGNNDDDNVHPSLRVHGGGGGTVYADGTEQQQHQSTTTAAAKIETRPLGVFEQQALHDVTNRRTAGSSSDENPQNNLRCDHSLEENDADRAFSDEFATDQEQMQRSTYDGVGLSTVGIVLTGFAPKRRRHRNHGHGNGGGKASRNEADRIAQEYKDSLFYMERLRIRPPADNLPFEAATSHCVCPVGTRSPKVLGCILAGKWIVSPAWLRQSYKANMLLAEKHFGNRFTKSPFERRVVYLSGSFLEECKRLRHEQRVDLCRYLVVECGRGVTLLYTGPTTPPLEHAHESIRCSVLPLPLGDAAHWQIVSKAHARNIKYHVASSTRVSNIEGVIDTATSRVKNVTWDQFLDLIPRSGNKL